MTAMLDVVGAFWLTEPGAGSDIAELASTATRHGTGYRLTGHKKYITGGQIADLLPVFARTERGVTAFLADAVNVCSSEYAVARYFSDAKVMEIIEGSTELQQTLIARAALHGQIDPLSRT